MARMNATYDVTTLQMALVGYQHERQKIDDKIREIQAALKGKTVVLPSVAAETAAAPKRVLSPAARRRIALAQKKRWAEHRRRKAQGGAEAK